MASMHFHAYGYTGKGYSDSEIRARDSRDPKHLAKAAPPNYPPLTIADPGGMRQAARLGSIDEALDWLEKEFTTYVPLDVDSFPVKVRLEYSRAKLQQTAANIVVYGYWARSEQYVARRIYPCDVLPCNR